MAGDLYDKFGRLKLTTHPDGIKMAHALQWALHLWLEELHHPILPVFCQGGKSA